MTETLVWNLVQFWASGNGCSVWMGFWASGKLGARVVYAWKHRNFPGGVISPPRWWYRPCCGIWWNFELQVGGRKEGGGMMIGGESWGLVDDDAGKWGEQVAAFFRKKWRFPRFSDGNENLRIKIRREMMIVVWILWLLGVGICLGFLGVAARDWIWRPYMLVQECRRQGIQGFPFVPIVGQMPAIDEVSNQFLCHGQIWCRRIRIDEFVAFVLLLLRIVPYRLH